MNHRHLAAWAAGMVFASVAGAQGGPAWVDEARSAAMSVPPKLLEVLKAEIEKGGPAGAIGVCNEQAPRMAQAASQQTGWAIRRVNEQDGKPAIFYCHPWEFDPGQPRVDGIGFKTRFRHYLNLDRTEARLARLLRDFRWDRVDRVFPLEAV